MTIAISEINKEPSMQNRMVCACSNLAIRRTTSGPICQRCSDLESRMGYDYHDIERRNNHGGNRKGSGRKPATIIA